MEAGMKGNVAVMSEKHICDVFLTWYLGGRGLHVRVREWMLF